MAYGFEIKAILDKEQWPQFDLPTIEPPIMKRKVGRPVKNRRRGEEEQRKGKRSKTLRCSICHQFGHNMLTCDGGKKGGKKGGSAKGGNKGASTSKKASNEHQQERWIRWQEERWIRCLKALCLVRKKCRIISLKLAQN